MKAFKYILLIGIAAVLLPACSSTKNLAKEQLEDKWILKTINNKDANLIFGDKIPFISLNFALNQISGHSGCNTFNGKYTYKNGIFQAPNMASTLMACPNMEGEQEFLSLLGQSSKLSIMNGELIFLQDNKVVMVFTRNPGITASELTGVWILERMEGRSKDLDFNTGIPTLEFDFAQNRLTGNAGCNRYNGTFTLSRQTLVVSPLITTRMACADMAGEIKFTGLLSGEINIEVDGNTLILKKGSNTIMTFKK